MRMKFSDRPVNYESKRAMYVYIIHSTDLVCMALNMQLILTEYVIQILQSLQVYKYGSWVKFAQAYMLE